MTDDGIKFTVDVPVSHNVPDDLADTLVIEEVCGNCGEPTESLTGYCEYCRMVGYHLTGES